MKKIVILGSTGSIGESALRVVAALPAHFQVIGLAAHRNGPRLLEQAQQFGVKNVAVVDPDAARACAARADGVAVESGPEGLARIAALENADLVLCAVVGMAGLKPVIAALECGHTVALATKEVLVAAGRMVTAISRRRNAPLLPVDSEHSAIFQCLQGQRAADVRRLLLTASGGPFAHRPELNLDTVTVAEALKHPRWNMGRKVTVDSATLMNKGLELMEARWLFDKPLACIDVLIHPESIVHSIVEFTDGAMLAQMSPPDMRFAIQYALTYPARIDGGLAPLDLAEKGALHFRHPDPKRFPCLRLAREAGLAEGTMPAVLNAANETGVKLFLDGRIRFSGIWHTVEEVMRRHQNGRDPALEEILEADRWARVTAEQVAG